MGWVQRGDQPEKTFEEGSEADRQQYSPRTNDGHGGQIPVGDVR